MNRFTVFLYLILNSIVGRNAASNAANVNHQGEILYFFLHSIAGRNAGRNAASIAGRNAASVNRP